MGNAISPCFHQTGSHSGVDGINLILWNGTTKTVVPLSSKQQRCCPMDRQHRRRDRHGRVLAGEIMLEHDHDRGMLICHANSFFVGRRIPSLSMDDQLVPGETYFILPADFFPCSNDDGVITSSSIASLCSSLSSASPGCICLNDGNGPFECIKDEDGKALIKVAPDFITRLILYRNICNNKISSSDFNDVFDGCDGNEGGSSLCSTPELKRQYDLLVGCKEQMWSPKLETIKECRRTRFYPTCDLFRRRKCERVREI